LIRRRIGKNLKSTLVENEILDDIVAEGFVEVNLIRKRLLTIECILVFLAIIPFVIRKGFGSFGIASILIMLLLLFYFLVP